MPRGRPRKNVNSEDLKNISVDGEQLIELNGFPVQAVSAEDINFGDDIVTINEIKDEKESNKEKEVSYTPTDPEWTDYVLAHLKPNEFQKGFPTVHGIRRLVGKFIGDIIRSESEVVQSPSPDNEYNATIVHTVYIVRHSDKETIVVNGASDLSKAVAKPPFDKFIVASADSRAEGKCLRRVLQINTVSAEEVSGEDQSASSDESITPTQISLLETIAKRNNINLEKFVKSNFDVQTIDIITREQGSVLCSKISEYQRVNDTIPENIKGYVSSWKNDFSKGDN